MPVANNDFVVDVSNYIRANIDDKTLSPEKVAAAFHMSHWTLQLKLSLCDTSFCQIRDQERQKAFKSLMSQGNITMLDIAYRLGYAYQSTLTRATYRWFGSPPLALCKRNRV